MSFVNTVDIIGDEALTNSILNGSITEIADNRVTSVGDSAFRGCSALIRADFPSVTGIYNTAFYDCSVLATLILRSETMCTLYYTGSFDGSPIVNGTGFIYVPAALYDSYRADSKWSTLANQFRVLEDYTVDGTVTGEVDPTRCRVRFFNEDGTYLGYVMVPNGGNATYPGDDPVKEGCAFKGWNPSPTNVTADMDCHAQFSSAWDDVFTAIADGTYKSKFAIGDTIPLDLGSAGVINMQIAAFDADNLADGSGKAPITWISKELLKSRAMNPKLSSTTGSDGGTIYTEGTGSIGGWEKSELRSYLKNTVKPVIQEKVRNAIKEVVKTHPAYDSAGAKFTQTTNDDVWIASLDEVYGGSSLYVGLFKNNNANRVKYPVGSGTQNAWWLRSAPSVTEFGMVYANGGINANGGSPAYLASVGIAFGFCT